MGDIFWISVKALSLALFAPHLGTTSGERMAPSPPAPHGAEVPETGNKQ